MKFINKHKVGIIAGIVIIIIGVLTYFALKSMFIIGNDKGKYGNRLDGIDKVKITDEKKNEIIKMIKEKAGIKDAKIDIQGKIINVSSTNAIDSYYPYSDRLSSLRSSWNPAASL